MAERLQKLIAQSGVASRRTAEALIVDGRVRVNGRIVRELGAKADLHHDRIEVDGKRLVAERPVYYLLHKPREVVTTLDDPEGRDTISDLLRGIPERVFPVGRLDYHTSGALLITNDGELSQALLHPRKSVPKQYIAKVKGTLEIRALDALRNGVVLDDGYRTKKAELFVMREEGGNTWLHITITEGKNRQIHRMGMAIGHPVMRLSRIGFANLTTEGLRPGDYRELYDNEVEKLKKEYVYGAAAPAVEPKSKPSKARSGKAGARKSGKPRAKPPVVGKGLFATPASIKRDADQRTADKRGDKRTTDKRSVDKRGGDKRGGDKRGAAKRTVDGNVFDKRAADAKTSTKRGDADTSDKRRGKRGAANVSSADRSERTTKFSKAARPAKRKPRSKP